MLSWLWSKFNKQKVFIGDVYTRNNCEYAVLSVDDDHMYLIDGRAVTIKMIKHMGDDVSNMSSSFSLYESFILSTYKLKECSDE